MSIDVVRVSISAEPVERAGGWIGPMRPSSWPYPSADGLVCHCVSTRPTDGVVTKVAGSITASYKSVIMPEVHGGAVKK